MHQQAPVSNYLHGTTKVPVGFPAAPALTV